MLNNYIVPNNLRLLFLLRSLADEVHELIEFRRNDNLGATVTLLAHLCVVGGNGIVLTTTTCGQALRVYTVIVLQGLNH